MLGGNSTGEQYKVTAAGGSTRLQHRRVLYPFAQRRHCTRDVVQHFCEGDALLSVCRSLNVAALQVGKIAKARV
jgi:CTP:molybdopterin cytidylyltransferase MocA